MNEAPAPSIASRRHRLPVWPDAARGLPIPIARSSLFTVGNKNEARNFFRTDHAIASVSGYSITYRGEELRQDDLDVFLQLLHLARTAPVDQRVQFTAYSLLNDVGWSKSQEGYTRLRATLERLHLNVLTIRTDARGWESRFAGPLVLEFATKGQVGESVTQGYVLLNSEIVNLFSASNYTQVSWDQRLRLHSPAAKFLHSYFSGHEHSGPTDVASLQRLTGSRGARLTDFRKSLRACLNMLIEVGFLRGYQVDAEDLVRVERKLDPPGPFDASGLSSHPELGSVAPSASLGPSRESDQSTLRMNETSHVYLLLFPERGLFKIGKADDVLARASKLAQAWGAPDLDRSWHVKVQRPYVFGLEKSLHFLLGGYRETFDTGDGRTEMFRMEGLIAALNGISLFASSHPGSVNIAKGLRGMLQQQTAARERAPAAAANTRAARKSSGSRPGQPTMRTSTDGGDAAAALDARLQRANRWLTILLARQHRIPYEYSFVGEDVFFRFPAGWIAGYETIMRLFTGSGAHSAVTLLDDVLQFEVLIPKHANRDSLYAKRGEATERLLNTLPMRSAAVTAALPVITYADLRTAWAEAAGVETSRPRAR